jgi:hypothetical protein
MQADTRSLDSISKRSLSYHFFDDAVLRSAF